MARVYVQSRVVQTPNKMNSPLLFTSRSRILCHTRVSCVKRTKVHAESRCRETRERFPQRRPPRPQTWTSRCKPSIIIMHVCAHTYTHNHTDPCTITRCLRRRPRSRARRIQTRGSDFALRTSSVARLLQGRPRTAVLPHS